MDILYKFFSSISIFGSTLYTIEGVRALIKGDSLNFIHNLSLAALNGIVDFTFINAYFEGNYFTTILSNYCSPLLKKEFESGLNSGTAGLVIGIVLLAKLKSITSYINNKRKPKDEKALKEIPINEEKKNLIKLDHNANEVKLNTLNALPIATNPSNESTKVNEEEEKVYQNIPSVIITSEEDSPILPTNDNEITSINKSQPNEIEDIEDSIQKSQEEDENIDKTLDEDDDKNINENIAEEVNQAKEEEIKNFQEENLEDILESNNTSNSSLDFEIVDYNEIGEEEMNNEENDYLESEPEDPDNQNEEVENRAEEDEQMSFLANNDQMNSNLNDNENEVLEQEEESLPFTNGEESEESKSEISKEDLMQERDDKSKQKAIGFVIDPSVLDLYKNILDDFCKYQLKIGSFEKSDIVKLDKFSKTYKDYTWSVNNYSQRSIESIMLGDEDSIADSEEDAEDLVTIEDIKKLGFKYMKHYYYNFEDYKNRESFPGSKELKEKIHRVLYTNKNNKTGIVIRNIKRAYVNNAALQSWLDNSKENWSLKEIRFRNADFQVQQLFLNLEDNMRSWLFDFNYFGYRSPYWPADFNRQM